MGIAGRWPRICAQINFAVASDVVMPRPSWPAATNTDGSCGEGPIKGSLSGVAGRKTVQTRIAERKLRSGMYSKARCNMRARKDSSTAGIFRVVLARRANQNLTCFTGLHIEGHGIGSEGVSALQIAEFDDLMVEKIRITVGDHEMAFARLDIDAGAEFRSGLPCGIDDESGRENGAVSETRDAFSDCGDRLSPDYASSQRTRLLQ